MPTALAVVEALMKALGNFVPDKRIAECSGSGAIALGGRALGKSRGYVQYEIFTGGTGARLGKDGVTATAFHLSNCKTAPIEIIESEFPTRVERFELLTDSCGPGTHRGGMGFVREYRILQDQTRFSMRTDKHGIPPRGSSEGKEGGKGACIVNPGTPDEKRLPSRFGDAVLNKGDRLRIERPGGGGMGNPLERDPDRVLDDVRQGYVSIESAEQDYSVIVERGSNTMSIDTARTETLRNRLQQSR
jgi:N-methylhydantoinase B